MGYKNKKSKSDIVYAKKNKPKPNPFDTAIPATSKRLNPFEVHINKEKFHILGRTCKHDRGLPGVSRAKAQKKRAETLGKEFLNKHKTNKFHDKRIGRNLKDDQLPDSIVNARYIADKLAQAKEHKATKFNLNEDEILTHRGQTLEEIEQFRDERSDDEDLNDDILDANFTEAANFGGIDSEVAKDRKAAIDEMINEQKLRKLEINREKDELFELTEKLDANFKTILPLVHQKVNDGAENKKIVDDYDKCLKELIFEPRGTVVDKLQTPEEQAAKERNRLEMLENERLKRMRAEDDDAQAQPKHRSADDLDDGYFAMGAEEEVKVLTYDMDGNLITNIPTEEKKMKTNDATMASTEDVNINDGDVDDSDVDDDDDNDNNDDDDSNDDSDEDSDAESVDNLSDLRETDSENEEVKSCKNDMQKKSKIIVKKIDTITASDIPFIIEMPGSYIDFAALLSNRTPAEQATIVERLIKCNSPKLVEVNREHIVKLFAFLLQYINDMFVDANELDIEMSFKIFDLLMPHLYDLVHLNPERMSQTFLKVIKEKHAEFLKNPTTYPTLETAIYFKIIANLYSTSDFQHGIVTPAYIFIQHILSSARVSSRQDIALGLFLITIALEFGQRSKRFLPAVLNYLQGIIFVCIPKSLVEVLKIMPPFESVGPLSKLLAIAKSKESTSMEEELLNSIDLVTTSITLDFKIRALNMALKLISNANKLLEEHIGAQYFATNVLQLFDRLPIDAYPEFIKAQFETTKSELTLVASKPLTKLLPLEKKPKALRLLEPRIEPVYDDKRRPKMTKDQEEKAKLLHKIKRETKGAIREIRLDTAYVQELRIQQQIQSDKERHEKVKRIYQEASIQQGELNELARAKKRKKF